MKVDIESEKLSKAGNGTNFILIHPYTFRRIWCYIPTDKWTYVGYDYNRINIDNKYYHDYIHNKK